MFHSWIRSGRGERLHWWIKSGRVSLEVKLGAEGKATNTRKLIKIKHLKNITMIPPLKTKERRGSPENQGKAPRRRKRH